MKKPSILLISFLCVTTLSWSQRLTSKRTTINTSIVGSGNASTTDLPFFSSSADAEKIVCGIMGTLGLQSNFKVKIANVPNVEATIKHHERYILYNPEFVNKVNEATKNKWASIFILAHEVGHHLDGHTAAGLRSNPTIELEADEFAGSVLCKMGATLEQAQLAMYYIANVASSKTHPGRPDRLAAIANGWNKAQAEMQPSVAAEQFQMTSLTN